MYEPAPTQDLDDAARAHRLREELEPFPRFRRRIDAALADNVHVEDVKSALNDAAARRLILRLECVYRSVEGDEPTWPIARELGALDDLIELLVLQLERQTP